MSTDARDVAHCVTTTPAPSAHCQLEPVSRCCMSVRLPHGVAQAKHHTAVTHPSAWCPAVCSRLVTRRRSLPPCVCMAARKVDEPAGEASTQATPQEGDDVVARLVRAANSCLDPSLAIDRKGVLVTRLPQAVQR